MVRRLSYMRDWIKYDRRLPRTRGHYPDGAFAALSMTFCLASEQPEPGTFPAEAVLRALLDIEYRDPLDPSRKGPRRGKWVRFLVEQGDLVKQPDGSLVLPNWRHFQELTSAERMQDKRARDAALDALVDREDGSDGDGESDADVTQRVTERDATPSHNVTGSVTTEARARAREARGPAPVTGAPPERLETRDPSLRSGRRETPAGENARGAALGGDLVSLISLIEDKTGRPWAWSPGSKTMDKLRYDLRDFGEQAVRRQLLAAYKANSTTDANVLVEAAHRLLEPISKGKVNGHAGRPALSTESYDDLMQRDDDELSFEVSR